MVPGLWAFSRCHEKYLNRISEVFFMRIGQVQKTLAEVLENDLNLLIACILLLSLKKLHLDLFLEPPIQFYTCSIRT